MRGIKGMKSYDYEIDEKKADEMLQNVFKAAGTAPNRVPFDKLRLRQQAKIGNLIAARTIAFIFLILVCASPLMFRPALNDTSGPQIVDDSLEDNVLSITLTDAGSGVDFKDIYAKGDAGNIIEPSTIDTEKSVITFADPEKSMNIYIPDNAGNITHALFTKKK